MNTQSTASKFDTLPLIALRGVVWYPWVKSTLFVKSDLNVRAVANAIINRGRLVAIAKKNDRLDGPISRDDLFSMGVRASLLSTTLLPDGTIKIAIIGSERILAQGNVVDSGGFYSIQVAAVPPSTPSIPANSRQILEELFRQGSSLRALLSDEEFESLPARGEPGYLADLIGGRLSSASYQTRQAILETIDPWERLVKATAALRQHAAPPLDIPEAATAIAEWLERRLKQSGYVTKP